MKKSIFLMMVFLVLPVLSYAQPAITFDSEEHDFGTVAPTGSIEHVFDFSNTGDEELSIQKLRSSWGCTAVMASSSHLKPGEKGRITAKVDMNGRKGTLHKTVQVLSNDPGRPSVVLTLKAKIQE